MPRPLSVPTLRTRNFLLSFAAAALLTTLAPAGARAGLIMAVQSVSASAGSTNDVLNLTLTNTGPSAVTIGGFSFQIGAGSGVTFTSVDTTTTPAYIFAGHSTFGPDISNSPPNLPGLNLAAGDTYATFGSGFSLGVGAGNAVGLGRVHFNVSTGASGSIPITLAGFPSSNLSNANGVDITQSSGTTFTSGTVTVLGIAVPEPSSLALGAFAVAMGSGYWLRNRRPAV